VAEYYKNPEKNGAKIGVLIFFVLTGIVSLILGWLGGWGKSGEKGWFGEVKTVFVFEEEVAKNSNSEEGLIEKIKKIITEQKGQYAVYVYRLDDNKGYGVWEEEKMPTMSLAKVPVMLAAYKAVEKGKLDLGNIYSLKLEVVNNDPEASASATPVIKTVKKTLAELLTEMGVRSNNYAAEVVIGAVGKPQILSMVTTLGMKNTDFEGNETTAMDVMRMWRSVYENVSSLTEEHKKELWSNLQDSIYEDRLAKGVVGDVRIIHKVGTDVDVWSDSGILIDQDENTEEKIGPIIVVILNKEVDLDEAGKAVPEITKLIWEFEKGRKGV
jgi:hypothetical protein